MSFGSILASAGLPGVIDIPQVGPGEPGEIREVRSTKGKIWVRFNVRQCQWELAGGFTRNANGCLGQLVGVNDWRPVDLLGPGQARSRC